MANAHQNQVDATSTTEPWISSREACKHLGISMPTLQRWIKSGHLKPKRGPQGVYRFRRSELDLVLE